MPKSGAKAKLEVLLFQWFSRAGFGECKISA